jgi:hypothetical protein
LTGSLLLPKIKSSKAKIAPWKRKVFTNHRRAKNGKDS